jgi:fluoride exporter
MVHALIVGVGGFLGSVLRYWLSGLAHRWAGDAFPVGTLAVNLLGCLAIGMIGSVAQHTELFRPETRLFITVGILGGFTTFSAFGYETFALLQDRQYLFAVANVGANVLLGVAAVILGWMAGKVLAV